VAASLQKRGLHAQQARVRRGAIVNHIEPVVVARIARAAPFILGELDIADAGAAFDLDRAPLEYGRFPAGRAESRAVREDVKAGVVRKPRRARERRRRYVARRPSLSAFVFGGDPDRDLLDLGVVALFVFRGRTTERRARGREK